MTPSPREQSSPSAPRRWGVLLGAAVARRASLGSASVVVFAVRSGSVALGLVATVILGRLLGTAGYGSYAFAFALVTVLGVLGRLGLDMVTVREVAAARQRDELPHVGATVRGAQLAVSIASAAIGLSAAAIATAADSTQLLLMLAAAGLLVFMSLNAVQIAALQGLQAIVSSSVLGSIIRPLLLVGGLGVLWALGCRRPSVSLGVHVGAAAVTCLVTGAVLHRRSPLAWRKGGVPRLPLRTIATSGLPMVAVYGLGILSRQTDVIMLRFLLGTPSAGSYAAAARIAAVGSFVLGVANYVLAPRFAALHAAKDTAGLQRLAALSAAYTACGGVILAGFISAAATPLLAVFGKGFTDASLALVLLAAAFMINAFCGSVGMLLLMAGHEREVGVVTGATALLNVALNAIGIPLWGMPGAALATLVSLGVWNLVLVVRVRKRLLISPTPLGLLRPMARTG